MRREMPPCVPPPVSSTEQGPRSRTYQYRKVMKPMLERKRRARINRCLDELKDLMVWALQAEGENVSKLEKADILELTVRHLHRLRKHDRLTLREEERRETDEKYKEGFTRCAHEVSRYLAAPTEYGIARESGVKLLQHLGAAIRSIDSIDNRTVYENDNRQDPFHTPPSSPQGQELGGPVWRPW